jgi:hypothetical protein
VVDRGRHELRGDLERIIGRLAVRTNDGAMRSASVRLRSPTTAPTSVSPRAPAVKAPQASSLSGAGGHDTAAKSNSGRAAAASGRGR